ncbi:hypothetical protein PAXRUDRAFT_834540 [Paxillus rubicundulus Ve08.2h10]|uniref:Uncharacterized protein n=1 Tax=Paxillus rubicundulus Ve08.2h10 TaxID=930991 RepID=A0A0D0DJY1_9AGAM|nr:hypothetical protein PAXRUDRAFT_834540 [Paxillus rubicundulus Ve08.2h10]
MTRNQGDQLSDSICRVLLVAPTFVTLSRNEARVSDRAESLGERQKAAELSCFCTAINLAPLLVLSIVFLPPTTP